MLYKKNFILLFLASFTTVTSLVMVVSNAINHGVTLTDKTLLSLLAIVFSLGTHLLPAMSKHRTGLPKIVAWLIWCACLVITMYNYLSYFTNASTYAGELRAKNSVQVINSNEQIESAKQALSRISARSVAEVARALSKSKGDKRIAALDAELDEAKRAEKLQDDLITLQGNAVAIQSAESNDPVISKLESVTHRNAAVISLTIGATSALVLELLAAFWWYELRSNPQPEVKPEISVLSVLSELTESSGSDDIVSSKDEKLEVVKQAIDSGTIKPTVTAIRKYLRCGQDKAFAIHKLLVNHRGNVTQGFLKNSSL
jgi:hypothetical protein